MNWVIVVILALALSVPVGSAVATFGVLALEFVLGLLVETGEKIEADSAKKRTATIVLVIVLGGILLCLCVVCVAAVAVLTAQSRGGILS